MTVCQVLNCWHLPVLINECTPAKISFWLSRDGFALLPVLRWRNARRDNCMKHPQDLDTRDLTVEENNINLLDLVIVLLRRKKSIIIGTMATAALVFFVSFFWMDSKYRPYAKILPSQTSSAASTALSQIASVSGMLTPLLGSSSPSSGLFVALLKSRTVLDAVIDRFGLMEAYKNQRLLGLGRWLPFSREGAREALVDLLSTEIDTASNVVTLGVEDRSAQKATEMTNAFVEELKKLLATLSISDASQRRLFLEAELKKAHASLTEAEEAMQAFQETTGAIKIDDQARAVLEGVAVLRAQIALKEIQLKVMKTYATEQNPDFKKSEEEYRGMLAELKKLEATGMAGESSTLIATGSIPSLGVEYLRRVRDFKYLEAIYEVLVKQYEAARLDEANEAIIVQVVDVAVVPEKAAWPKPILMTLVGVIFGFFLSITYAFFREYLERASQKPGGRERLEKISSYLPFRKT